MKKIILLLGVLIMANTSAFADCDYACVSPYNMNGKFKTFMSNVGGVNAATEKAAEKILKKEVLKMASVDDLKVSVDSYSSKDLKNGIFKSVNMSGKNVSINNVYFTSLDLKTLCDFNYIKFASDEVIFMEDFPLSYNMTLSSNAINKTMQNEKFQKIIRDLNKLGETYAMGIKISSTKVSVKASKFYYVLGFNVPFVKNEQKVVLQSDLQVKNGKIDLTNTRLLSGPFNFDLSHIDFILNYLNPLDFTVKILEEKDAKIVVKNVTMKDTLVVADGVVVVPKD